MKSGVIVTTIVAVAAIGGMLAAFLVNSSPYVTVAQARTTSGDRLHLAGDLLKETLQTDVANQTVRFQLRDEAGETVAVRYLGPPPANMGSATKVVAIGKLEGNEFVSEKMLLKCPSKYEGEEIGSVAKQG
jgi:cytochrome c-type biogenesis protein CcmE